MSGPPRDELEARVARLERVLERVLALLRDLRAGSEVPPDAAEEAHTPAPPDPPPRGAKSCR